MKRIISFILMTVILVMSLPMNQVEAKSTNRIKLSTAIFVYQSNSFRSQLIGTIKEGTTITKKKQYSNGWLKIYYTHGKSKYAWVNPTGEKKSITKSLKFYNYPIMNYSALQTVTLKKGSYWLMGQTLHGWYVVKIVKPNGQKGIYYLPMAKRTLTLEKDTAGRVNLLDQQTIKVKKGSYVILQEQSNFWFQIQVGKNRYWIQKVKTTRSDAQKNFEKAFQIVIKFEGNKTTDHPLDGGGKTRYGITQATYDEYIAWYNRNHPDNQKTLQDVSKIAMSEVKEIYYKYYYLPNHCDEMSYELAAVILDTSVHFGVYTTRALMARAMYLPEPPSVQPAFGDFTKYVFYQLTSGQEKLWAQRIIMQRMVSHNRIVQKDPTQKVFLAGWLKRDQELKRILGL